MSSLVPALRPRDLVRRVRALALDLRWTWCPTTQRLFAALDPVRWEASNHDPLLTLAGLDPARLAAVCADEHLVILLEEAELAARTYHDVPTWWEREDLGATRIAYFCSEYAVHESLPQYSGGLGVLAGDHLKAASDLGVPLVAVGLLYQHGYYRQELEVDGATRVLYPDQDPAGMPILDTGKEVLCPLGRGQVRARIWRQQVGRVPIYLLDTRLPGAPKAHRELTEGLYKGEPDLRLRQQVLLGVGGVRALRAVRERVDVVHLNEGHAAFANLERLREEVARGRSFERALERVRRSSVFTTHTPVPAGHDRYRPSDVARHLKPVLDELGLSREALADLGREVPGDRAEPLCMTVLALRTSERVNGVSELHGRVSREMWQRAYGAARVEDVPIGHVTNGVHPRTWLPAEAEDLYARRLKATWEGVRPQDDPWRRADRVNDEELWELRAVLRRRLVQFVRTRLEQQARRRGADEAELVACRAAFAEDALTIGFARRFATYKRAPLVFHDRKRLAALLSDPRRPVQLVFAGKAHPRDEGGQAFAREVHALSQRPEFAGRVALLEEYDMGVGRVLTAGCDVWLNNPLRPHEASGTSGMKPPLVGGLNLSILDGWWPEAFDGRNGWSIGDASEEPDQKRRDARDAEALYALLEDEVLPLFHRRGKDGRPTAWIARMRQALRTIPRAFSAHRMLEDYVRRAYLPAGEAVRGR